MDPRLYMGKTEWSMDVIGHSQLTRPCLILHCPLLSHSTQVSTTQSQQILHPPSTLIVNTPAKLPSPGIIPLPTIGLRASTPLFATVEEQLASRKDLELLNQDARSPTRTSERLESTLRELQQLLKPDRLTELWDSLTSNIFLSNECTIASSRLVPPW